MSWMAMRGFVFGGLLTLTVYGVAFAVIWERDRLYNKGVLDGQQEVHEYAARHGYGEFQMDALNGKTKFKWR